MFCYIVDDDPTFCVDLRDKLLGGFATAVVYATSFDKALLQLGDLSALDQTPDIVFVDYRLDMGKNGIELVRRLQADQVAAPLVLLTEFDSEEVVEEARALGSEVIPKSSIESHELLQRVCLFALGRWSAMRRQQRNELVRQRDHVLELAAEIAHEMRNICNQVNVSTQVLNRLVQRDITDKDMYRQTVAAIEDIVKQANFVTGLLLDYGSSQEVKLTRRVTNLPKLFSIVLREPKYATLRAEMAEEPVNTSCDGEAMARVLRILLDNVQIHAGESAAIRIAFERGESSVNSHLAIDIEDDGVGVPAEHRERIFVPGDRGEKRIKYVDGQGWGLGLPFARKLIEAHSRNDQRAVIKCVEPRWNQGARFRIILP